MRPFDAPRSFTLSAAAPAVRTLAPGRALALRARAAGELRVARGAVWVTLQRPRSAQALGDVHLGAGERLCLQAGDRLVLEPIHPRGAPAHAVEAAAFDWAPRAACGAADVSWQTAVAAPAGELRRALRDAGGALARLARGLLAWAGLARQPRAAPRTGALLNT